MKYVSSSGFRRALEDHLIQMSLQGGVTLARLRKLVVLDRFLARLIPFQPDQWVIKGGFALQLHLEEHAAATKNIDLLLGARSQVVFPALQRAAALEPGDWFSFEVMQAEGQISGLFGGLRYPINCMLDGHTFENFHIDVTVNNPPVTCMDYLNTSSLLSFADMAPVRVPCETIAQLVAEKLYVYTRPHTTRESSRVKYFADILLLAGLAEFQSNTLLQALQEIFAFVGTHTLPPQVPPPAKDWPVAFEKMAFEMELRETQLDRAYFLVQQFLDPLLNGSAVTQRWDPASWGWM
jgi:hypothetical protein